MDVRQVNVQTGEVTERNFTPEEKAEREAAIALHEAGATQRAINDLELQVTPRRMREAALGIDGGWLAGVDAQISALRSKL